MDVLSSASIEYSYIYVIRFNVYKNNNSIMFNIIWFNKHIQSYKQDKIVNKNFYCN